jgi:prepilin-type N-terminal cleavage/methylation domain-containing protein
MHAIKNSRSGFTLMEIMLVLGIIAILVAIVIAAINPTKQLNDARGADRRASIRELESAIVQYIIDGNSVTSVPTGIVNAQPICRSTATGAVCSGAGGYDLSALSTNGTYIVDVPVDPTETGAQLSGYRIYQIGSFIKVCSSVLDASCGS